MKLSGNIPFDSYILRAVTDELKSSLVGGVIQNVYQPQLNELILSIRNHGANFHLLISCDATFARVHLTLTRKKNPTVPQAFCMICRKYLEGRRISEVRQRGFDRILDLKCTSADGDLVILSAELMGKHSNVILMDDHENILDAMKHVTNKVSRHRETLPGKKYISPPVDSSKLNPWNVGDEVIEELANGMVSDPAGAKALIMSRFHGMSPFLTREILLRSESMPLSNVWQSLFAKNMNRNWQPIIIRGEHTEYMGAYPVSTVQYPAENCHSRANINIALDHFYGNIIPRYALDNSRHELVVQIDRALKTRLRQKESLDRSLLEAGRAEDYMNTGNLLLANLHAIEDGVESTSLIDYYQPEPVEREIALDPRLSARQNADVYFRRYRKARDGAERQRGFMEQTVEEIEVLQTAQQSVEDASDIQAITLMRSELINSGMLRLSKETDPDSRSKTPDYQGKKIRTFHVPEGWEILVGENSEANDFLTSKVASSNDIWMHVRANSSAHVVIRTKNSPTTVPQSVLHKAALLAAKHSAAKHSSVVPVDWTLKKYVRRPRGSASGAATYQNERTIYVNPKDD